MKVFSLIKKNMKTKKKLTIKFALIFNGDLTYLYPTPDKIRMIIHLANVKLTSAKAMIQELNKIGINLHEEYWYIYIPANCDRIQKLIKELGENDYRAPKVEKP